MIDILLVAIPLLHHDQLKLENVVRKIPAALVETRVIDNFERKYYTYPQMDDKGFKIFCEADYFGDSKVPSKTQCSLNMLIDQDPKKDEHKVKFQDPAVVNNLFQALTYGTDVKKLYSTEQVYGMGINGKYGYIFRYVLTCTTKECQLTMSTPPADE